MKSIDLSQYIGFIISALVVLFLMLKELWHEKQRKKTTGKSPLKKNKERERNKQRKWQTDKEKRVDQSVERKIGFPVYQDQEDAYAIKKRATTSKGAAIFRRQGLRQAVLMQEILNKPKWQ